MPSDGAQAQGQDRNSTFARAGNGDSRFRVASIITDRINRGRRQFLITWHLAKIKTSQERVNQSNMNYVNVMSQAVLVEKTVADARNNRSLQHNEKLVALRSTWFNKTLVEQLNEEARLIVAAYEAEHSNAGEVETATVRQAHNTGSVDVSAERSNTTSLRTPASDLTSRSTSSTAVGETAEQAESLTDSDQLTSTTESIISFLKDWPDSTPVFGQDVFPLVEYQLSMQGQLGAAPSQLTSRLLKLKRKRSVVLVKKFFDVRSMIRKCKLDASGARAFVLQAVGGVMKRRCQRCRVKNGPFDKCVVDQERKRMFKRNTTETDQRLCFNGACACCSYAGLGPRCTYHISSERTTGQMDEQGSDQFEENQSTPDSSSTIISRNASSVMARPAAVTPPSSPPSIAASTPVIRRRSDRHDTQSRIARDDQHNRRQHHRDAPHYHEYDRVRGRNVNLPWPVNIHTTIGPQPRSGYTPRHHSSRMHRNGPSARSASGNSHRQSSYGSPWS